MRPARQSTLRQPLDDLLGTVSCVRVLRGLFQREAERIEELMEALRTIAAETEPRPRAVWIYGSAARGEDLPESDLDILVVASDARHRSALEDRFHEALMDVSDEWTVSPAISVGTVEEVLEGLDVGEDFYVRIHEDAIPVYGQLPVALSRRG